ncbi:MAG: hypothetical protein QOK23_3610 [Gammaproteobacteria bacterium]|jgi:hypothetical protein|nr:hypothetical protein [Gammaproteobacteria bacterium]
MSVLGCANTGTPNPSDGSGRMQKIVAEGTCWAGLWVEMAGSVSEAQLIKSTDAPRIDAACFNAVRGQQFEADFIVDPLLSKPGELRRYKVAELHWQQKSPAR